jgi:hypothetical protein
LGAVTNGELVSQGVVIQLALRNEKDDLFELYGPGVNINVHISTPKSMLPENRLIVCTLFRKPFA